MIEIKKGENEMGLSTEEDLKTFKRVVFEYPKEHEKLKKEISRLDQEINDLMHILELGKLDSRSLKDIAEERNFSEQLYVPEDGEVVEF